MEEKLTRLIQEDSPLRDVPKTHPDACNPVKIRKDTVIQGALATLCAGLPTNGSNGCGNGGTPIGVMAEIPFQAQALIMTWTVVRAAMAAVATLTTCLARTVHAQLDLSMPDPMLQTLCPTDLA